jgi:hypothetical protein
MSEQGKPPDESDSDEAPTPDASPASGVPSGELPPTTTTGDPAVDVRTSPDAGATTRAERGDDLDDADQVHDER